MTKKQGYIEDKRVQFRNIFIRFEHRIDCDYLPRDTNSFQSKMLSLNGKIDSF